MMVMMVMMNRVGLIFKAGGVGALYRQKRENGVEGIFLISAYVIPKPYSSIPSHCRNGGTSASSSYHQCRSPAIILGQMTPYSTAAPVGRLTTQPPRG